MTAIAWWFDGVIVTGELDRQDEACKGAVAQQIQHGYRKVSSCILRSMAFHQQKESECHRLWMIAN